MASDKSDSRIIFINLFVLQLLWYNGGTPPTFRDRASGARSSPISSIYQLSITLILLMLTAEANSSSKNCDRYLIKTILAF